jgi:carboxylesterase type B
MLFPASALFLLLAIVLFKIPRYQNAVVLSHSRLYVGQQINAHTQVFRGIAYANAPVARLRFSRPVPVTEQPGLTIARNYGPACPQKAKYALSNGISEDCLSLNIVRSSKRSKKAPVIVWIHGGNNNNGQSALYDGLSFVEASSNMGLPILFVTINYRLNGFGFLASNDLLQDGNVNLGLHDQNLALHWVQKHISAFGGNPEKVIVMGESAGAANTWSHLLRSSRSKAKLFHGAILISGSPGAVFPHGTPVQSSPLLDFLFN